MDSQVDSYLAKVREQEKSFRSKISRVLAEFETYLAHETTVLSLEEVEKVMNGVKEQKYKGLVELSGLPGKFGSSLKNSSHTALSLILKLLTSSSTAAANQSRRTCIWTLFWAWTAMS